MRSSDAWPEREPQEDARRRAVVEGLRRRVAATTAASDETAAAAPATATAPAVPASSLPPPPQPPAGPPPSAGQPGQAASAMSQWVSVLSASAGATAPTRVASEEDIAAYVVASASIPSLPLTSLLAEPPIASLSAMFPDAGRTNIVRALTERCVGSLFCPAVALARLLTPAATHRLRSDFERDRAVERLLADG